VRFGGIDGKDEPIDAAPRNASASK